MIALRTIACLASVLFVTRRSDAQVEPPITESQLIAFLTVGGDSRYESGLAKARILASEVGERASPALTGLLSQGVRDWLLTARALDAARYNPISVPETLLLRYVSLGGGHLIGVDPVVAGELRSSALLALAYRPRPGLVGFWERLWDTDREPLIRQIVLVALACTAPERLVDKLTSRYESRLLNEVAGRIKEELARGGEAEVCHGGESTRGGAWSFRPGLAEPAREAGRDMLKRAGVMR